VTGSTQLNLRQGESFRAIEAALAAIAGCPGFRVIHFSVQTNHLHFLVESAGAEALSLGRRRSRSGSRAA
jgi:REP element-mobilizing transposase RayT